MRKTLITKEHVDERDETCTPTSTIDLKGRAWNDPTYFVNHMLGIKPQTFQHLIYKQVAQGDTRIAICSSRQIGKSIGLAGLAIWSVFFNKYPSGRTIYDKSTKVVIISKDDEASKKLMGEIRSMLVAGDSHMSMITQGRSKNYFTHRLSTDKGDPNNKKQITFKHYGIRPGERPSMISCFPPTDSVRGNSADLLILDEAAFVEDEIYRDAIKPTVSTTGGTIILSSTPKGQHGFYYETFDPFDKNNEHEYKRFWFPWTICELEGQRKVVAEERKTAERMGTIKSFMQEYEAEFTVDEEAFFDLDKVDQAVDDTLTQQYEHKHPCSLGIDYGMTSCNTVLTITTQDHDTGKIILLYQHEFELGFDDNLLMDEKLEHSIPNLCKRFNITHIIPDNCAQGYRTNMELASKGYPVLSNSTGMGGGWNFRSDQADRNRSYVAFKSKLNQGLIKIPRIPELVHQMKTLQATDNKIYTSIRKPSGGKDDRIDSFMMSTVPYTMLEDEGSVTIDAVGKENVKKRKELGGRYDTGIHEYGIGNISKELMEEYETWNR